MTSQRLELDEPSKAVLQEARKLQRRKERKASGRFLVEGRQGVREALRTPGLVESLFVRWAQARENTDLVEDARAAGVPVYAVSEQNLATLTDTVTPQGIVAVAKQLDVPLADVLTAGSGAKLVVICAQIRDPGNAGTVIRCADSFGADAVVFTSGSVEVYNPKAVRASVGSMFHLPLVVNVELSDAIAACREAGMQVFATDGAIGTDLTRFGDALAQPTAWVMGNEAWGLPLEHAELADATVAVPIYGHAESLNLATAAAVCLYASASAQHASRN